MNHKKAFTIVETLVAIAILMIAVVGPLVIANKGLTAALYANDQMTATFLAQEEMEFIRHFKDNTVFADQINGFRNFTNVACSMDHPCAIIPSDDLNYPGYRRVLCGRLSDTGDAATQMCQVANTLPLEGFAIDFCTAGPQGQPKDCSTPLGQFRRYYYTSLLNSGEVVVTVKVTWYKGTVANEVSLVSDITATNI